MLLGMVEIEPGGSNLVKADFCALADRLSPSVQRARREKASLAFCRVSGTIGAAKSGCVVIGSAPLHNPRSIISMTRKLRAGFICCGRACGGWTDDVAIKRKNSLSLWHSGTTEKFENRPPGPANQ